jgi:pimeloyl-ACP methyl ester carboxylesterase
MTHSGFALAHALDRPDADAWAGLVILHGAGSRKENHADMARAAAAAGLATVRFDMRGHGETGGLLDGRAIVAICPAPAPLLARGLRIGELEVAADTAALETLLAAHPLEDAVAALDIPVLIQHAEGDERVPVAGSRSLAALFRHPASRLEVVAGGDQRSVQHDARAQAAALAWLREAMLA